MGKADATTRREHILRVGNNGATCSCGSEYHGPLPGVTAWAITHKAPAPRLTAWERLKLVVGLGCLAGVAAVVFLAAPEPPVRIKVDHDWQPTQEVAP